MHLFPKNHARSWTLLLDDRMEVVLLWEPLGTPRGVTAAREVGLKRKRGTPLLHAEHGGTESKRHGFRFGNKIKA